MRILPSGPTLAMVRLAASSPGTRLMDEVPGTCPGVHVGRADTNVPVLALVPVRLITTALAPSGTLPTPVTLTSTAPPGPTLATGTPPVPSRVSNTRSGVIELYFAR